MTECFLNKWNRNEKIFLSLEGVIQISFFISTIE